MRVLISSRLTRRRYKRRPCPSSVPRASCRPSPSSIAGRLSRTVTHLKMIMICSAPRTVELKGPSDAMAGDEQRQTKTSVAYLMNDVRDVHETFVLRILSALLLDGPTSVFHQALIESGLGAPCMHAAMTHAARLGLQSQHGLRRPRTRGVVCCGRAGR